MWQTVHSGAARRWVVGGTHVLHELGIRQRAEVVEGVLHVRVYGIHLQHHRVDLQGAVAPCPDAAQSDQRLNIRVAGTCSTNGCSLTRAAIVWPARGTGVALKPCVLSEGVWPGWGVAKRIRSGVTHSGLYLPLQLACVVYQLHGEVLHQAQQLIAQAHPPAHSAPPTCLSHKPQP